ncbi:hypothetical protein GCM10011579_092570 [Streptomyces albiflavescens]|uniref:Uncharacterized protein n=1 Tax=Streptomyces albiflavescens TaxID=1623582 RepID=A0A917YGF2_9ACTN|nr:hypothetical protein [Streptomyces albiflavescens]GGN93768.1 hypothetical protein GCM10011579_092570 [Streptomyces albiflavescens]
MSRARLPARSNMRTTGGRGHPQSVAHSRGQGRAGRFDHGRDVMTGSPVALTTSRGCGKQPQTPVRPLEVTFLLHAAELLGGDPQVDDYGRTRDCPVERMLPQRQDHPDS